MPSPVSVSGTCVVEHAGGNEGGLLPPSRGRILKKKPLRVHWDTTAPAVLWSLYHSGEHSHLKEHKVRFLNTSCMQFMPFSSATFFHIKPRRQNTKSCYIFPEINPLTTFLYAYMYIGRMYGQHARVLGECIMHM